jgi:hypothetical protein
MNVQRDSTRVRHDESPVADSDLSVDDTSVDQDLLIGLEHIEQMWIEIGPL